ncbi:FtsX-like permease family protein [Iodobacter sp. LRB]|uniref:ABC transporter permease n=1 Tax=unclassified Iodobacter TaxID=235634 RepID=UPI0015D46F63|nr:FtsX-like permease family protein [Iodobacter sp. BJB302]
MHKLNWRLFYRSFQAGEYRTLLAALIIAIAALTAVGLLSARMEKLLALEANDLLAADAVISSDHALSASYKQQAERLGLNTAETAIFPSMAGFNGQVMLSSVKAVSHAYPLRGQLKLAPDGHVSTAPEAGSAYADARLAATLKLKLGDTLEIGQLRLKLAALIEREPDAAMDFSGLQPRLMINQQDLAASGLLGFGSRVKYRQLVAGPPATIAKWHQAVQPKLIRGEKLEDVRDARPEVKTALERAERFLRLTSLLAGCLAAMAILLAARRFATRHFDTVALLRTLGASRGTVRTLLLSQLALLTLAASVVGGLLGWGAQSLLVFSIQDRLPATLPDGTLLPWLVASLLGFVLLMGSAGPMLLALANTPPLRVLRHELEPKASLILQWALTLVALLLLLWWIAAEAKLALMVGAGIVATLLLAGGSGLGLLWLLPRILPEHPIKLALRQLLRHPGLAFAQLGALAIGLLGIWLLTVVEGDLLKTWEGRVAADAPNHFAVNIQPEQAAQFEQRFINRHMAAPALQSMIRGRWTMQNKQAIKPENFQEDRAKHLAEREFNLSWGDILSNDNRIVAGKPLNDAEPGFSVEAKLATTLNIKLGDVLSFDIAGSTVTAPVVNLREVNWDSFRVNFFVVASKALVADLPTSLITSFHLSEAQKTIVPELVQALPNVTIIDVGQVLAEVRRILDLSAAALRLVFLFCIAAGVTVLFAALDTTESERAREAAILRALGATSKKLRSVWLFESLLVGGIAGLVAGLMASIGGMVIGQELLELPVAFNYWLPFASLLAGAAITALAVLRRLHKLSKTSPLVLLRDAG